MKEIRYLLVGMAMSFIPVTFATIDGESRRQQASDQVWEEQIRPGAFGDRELVFGGSEEIVEIKAPFRAEDAAAVPISIHAGIPQQAERHIRSMHVYVDKNPVPLVGIFEFTPQSGRADLALRIRVDDFTFVRAIAELNTGELHMAKTFVRSLGGCSAPPGASVKESMANLGKTRLRLLGELQVGEPNLVQMQIRHPNITGMAVDPRTNAKPPAYFVNTFEVAYGDNPPFLKARTTFAISQDPNYRFFFVPGGAEGSLQVRAMDTRQHEFVSEHPLDAFRATAGMGKG